MLFVAMSFDDKFDPLFFDVIEPAAKEVECDGGVLSAHRVDLSVPSDSIVSEIVRCIGESRLVLADISTVGWAGDRWHRKRRPIRSANVMYEVGLAHATRLPEEVILVRGDSDRLDFDVAGVRVHTYPPEREAARARVRELLSAALKAVDQRRSLTVERALVGVTPSMWLLLHKGDFSHPSPKSMRDYLTVHEELQAIQGLLADGLIEAIYKPLPGDFMYQDFPALWSYRTTPFGRAVYHTARDRLEFNEQVEAWLQTPAGQEWLHSDEPG